MTGGNRMAVTGLRQLCPTPGAVLLLVTDVVLDRGAAVALSGVFTIGTAAVWSVPAAVHRA